MPCFKEALWVSAGHRFLEKEDLQVPNTVGPVVLSWLVNSPETKSKSSRTAWFYSERSEGSRVCHQRCALEGLKSSPYNCDTLTHPSQESVLPFSEFMSHKIFTLTGNSSPLHCNQSNWVSTGKSYRILEAMTIFSGSRIATTVLRLQQCSISVSLYAVSGEHFSRGQMGITKSLCFLEENCCFILSYSRLKLK